MSDASNGSALPPKQDEAPTDQMASLKVDEPVAGSSSSPEPQASTSTFSETAPMAIPATGQSSGSAAPSAGTSSTLAAPSPKSSTFNSPSPVVARDMLHSPSPSTSSTPAAGRPSNAAPPSSGPAPPSSRPQPSLQRPGPGAPLRAGMAGRMPMGMAGRGGGQAGMGMGQSRLPPSLQAKMDAMSKRAAAGAGTPGHPGAGPSSPASGAPDPTSMSALLASAAAAAQAGGNQSGPSRPAASSPIVPSMHSRGPPNANARPGGMAMGGLAARRAAAGGAGPAPPGSRPGMGAPGGAASAGGGLGGMGRLRRPGVPGMTLSQMGMGQGSLGGSNDGQGQGGSVGGSAFSNFGKIVDPSGRLNFHSRAVIHAEGVDFSNGHSYKIKMDEMELCEELGRGNYGAVQRVYHRPTKVMMAMKEIRLELDESKLNQIIMELDILHRAVAPEIVEFYGAFTIESCVYYCMEYMDAGSLDTLHGDGVPEDILARITKSIVKGLGFLKDELEVMHRDVKPTNVLVNKKGEVKLVDFGVSGQLEKSLAKTNIGCQSYMAPERIKGEQQNNLGTYTVSSDVWSVGLSVIELAKGTYPYPPETYSNVFAQLQAIVYGPPPVLPEGYSDVAQDFVASCLRKLPETRPTYAQLLKHPWMLADAEREVDMVGWVERAVAAKQARQVGGQPVSSSAPEIQQGHGDKVAAANGATPAGVPLPPSGSKAPPASQAAQPATNGTSATSEAKPSDEVPAATAA